MKKWTAHVASGGELGPRDIGEIVEELVAEHGSDEEAADFLEALHRRGETPSEVAAFASSFLRHAEPFRVPPGMGPVMDVCGTGGDQLGIFNVSTTVMFVAAGAGARIVKHGNRKITSRSGGADVLEVLGIPADPAPDVLRAMLEEAGAVFLFAPRFHPAFRNLAAARSLLASRGSASILNMLGPLLNPARPQCQFVGVFSPLLLDVYAAVLPTLGCGRFWVVHGSAGDAGCMDEISTCGPTEVAERFGTDARRFTLVPASMGVALSSIEELRGGDAGANAGILTGLLEGKRRGAERDIVIVNSAAALIVAGVAAEWAEAMARARESLESGAACRVLTTMRRLAGTA